MVPPSRGSVISGRRRRKLYTSFHKLGHDSTGCMIFSKDDQRFTHPATLTKFGVSCYRKPMRYCETNDSDASSAPILLDPMNHRLAVAEKGQVGTVIKCYGHDVCAKEWYQTLEKEVQEIINNAGFTVFISSLNASPHNNALLMALGERWSDTTHTFHFCSGLEMTLTPTDFSAITGLRVGGDPIPLDAMFHRSTHAKESITRLLGQEPPDWKRGKIKYSWLVTTYGTKVCTTKEERDQQARAFLLYLFGTTLFPDTSGKTVPLYYLSALQNVDSISTYDWGAAALATAYRYMDAISRNKCVGIGGFWRAWEVWAYEYALLPNNPTEPTKDKIFPRMSAYRGHGVRNHALSDEIMYFRYEINLITKHQVCWQPWGPTKSWPPYVVASEYSTQRRCLLASGAGFAWYLAERVGRQSLGLDKCPVPCKPPQSTLSRVFNHEDMISLRYDSDIASKYLLPDDTPPEVKNEHLLFIPPLPTSPVQAKPPIVGSPEQEVILDLPPSEFEVPVQHGMLHFKIPMVTNAFGFPIHENIKSVSPTTVNGLFRMLEGMKRLVYAIVTEIEREKIRLLEQVRLLERQMAVSDPAS